MPCDNIIGVKNILFTFRDCDTDETVGPINHVLATDTLPTWKTCEFVNAILTYGYTRRTATNATATLNIIRNLGIPLAFYQGCASIDIQVEYMNGLVYTGFSGTVTSDAESDTHEVDVTVSFKTIDELLPEGAASAIAA